MCVDGRWYCDAMSSCWEKEQHKRLLAARAGPLGPDGAEAGDRRELRPNGSVLSVEDDERSVTLTAGAHEAVRGTSTEACCSRSSRGLRPAKPPAEPGHRRRRRGSLLALAVLALACLAAAQAFTFITAPGLSVAEKRALTTDMRNLGRSGHSSRAAMTARLDAGLEGRVVGEPDVLGLLLGGGGAARIGQFAVSASALGAVTAFKLFAAWAQDPIERAEVDSPAAEA